MEIYDASKFQPKIVLGVGAHADDLDFGSSGSIARLAKDGAAVHYLITTDGSKGSSDPAMTVSQLVKTRQTEQRAAAKVLGVQSVTFLGYEDGMLELTLGLKKDITRVIRRLQPDAVFCFDPSVLYSLERGFINHTDHRAAGQATVDAVFPLARDHLSFPQLYNDQGLAPHKVKTLLMTNFNQQNFAFDISQTLATKMAALQEHASQTSGSMAQIRERFGAMAAKTGQPLGLKYAEAFLRLDLPG
ncbi:MAG: PIG-L deacetylase family protein [Candidatus Saccharimonadales bacterium]